MSVLYSLRRFAPAHVLILLALLLVTPWLGDAPLFRPTFAHARAANFVASAKESPSPAPSAEVLFVSGLKGYVAPCGCTSHPLGGIAKLAHLVDEQKSAAIAANRPEPWFVTSGNVLFASETIAPGARAQEDARAKVVSEILHRFGTRASAIGPADKESVTRFNLPWLTVPVSVGSSTLPITFAAPKSAPEASRSGVAIGLSDQGWDESKRTLKEAVPTAQNFFDLVITGGSETVRTPQKVGRTWLIEAGEQGQYLGHLRFFAGASSDASRGEPQGTAAVGTSQPSTHQPRWAYYDAGLADQALLRRQLATIDKELSTATAAAATPRRSQRARVQAELAALMQNPPPPPKGPYFTLEVVTLTQAIPDSVAVASEVKEYNGKLCALSAASNALMACPPVKASEAHFVGSNQCQACHPAAYATWQSTPHSHALQTLENAGKRCDLSCIGCHSVGWQKPGGLCRPQQLEPEVATAPLANVGCESCHGPGSAHVQAPAAATLVKDVGVEVCLGCHTKEHSDLFDFATYRPRILGPGHGGPSK